MFHHPHAPRATALRRRDFLYQMSAAGAAALGGGLLAACGTPGTTQGGQKQAKDLSAQEKELDFSNWPLYIDENKQGGHPTLNSFEKRTGITVNYSEEINDNGEFFAKIRPQLSSNQPIGSDIIVMTDEWAGHLIDLGWVQKLDLDNIPNAKNVIPTLKSPPIDPKRQYTLPWQSGLTGIGVNTEVTGRPIKTIDELLTAPDLKGKVTVLTEMGDTMGLILLDMGVDPTNFTDAEFQKALDKLSAAVDSGHIRQATGNEYAPQLAKGNIAAAMAWSGDVIQLQFDNPKIQYVTPESGQMIWSDNMEIPILARHKTNAEKWMNYYYQPHVAARVAAWVNFICPIDGAQEAMKEVDPSLAENPLIFPTQDMLSKSHAFQSLPWGQLQDLRERFNAVIGL